MKEKIFRIWDTEAKKMRGDFLIDSVGRVYIDNQRVNPSEFILMQYAGVRDKNGRPVFEGDLFEAPHDFGPGGLSKRIAVCGWSEPNHGYQWEYWLLEDLEVIGNKYENPDMYENICSRGGFHDWGSEGSCTKCLKPKPEGIELYERQTS